MRRAAKVDDNQREIVEALRGVHCTVRSLASIGKGCPDLLVARGNVNYLLEVKDGRKPPSKRRLTDDERAFLASWAGPISIVESVDDALKAVGVYRS